MATVSLSVGREILLGVAGFGAGIVNGIAGGGTLISFPTLLAFGYPALTANVTSTVGIWPGYLGGAAGFRSEITSQRDRLKRLAPTTIFGATVGAILLLTTPSHTFTRIAPWLVLFASLLFATRPLIARIFGDDGEHRSHERALQIGVFISAVYGGYFGAAMGVILLAVLGLTLPDTMNRSSGIRTILSILANGIAAIVFIIHGSLAWTAIGLLAAGSLLGGYVGALVARRLPRAVFVTVVVCIGMATGIKLLVG